MKIRYVSDDDCAEIREPTPSDPRFNVVIRSLSPRVDLIVVILSLAGFRDERGLIAAPGSLLSDNLCFWARQYLPYLELLSDTEILERWDHIGEWIDHALARTENDPNSPVELIDLLSYYRRATGQTYASLAVGSSQTLSAA